MERRKRLFRDEVSGRTIWQVTDDDAVHHHLYPLNPSWTADGRWLIYVSYAGGHANLVAVDTVTLDHRQLTDIPDLIPYSACPAREGHRVYYTAGRSIWSVSIDDGETRCLARFEDGAPGNCSVSSDGSWLVTAVRTDQGRNRIDAVATDGSEIRTILQTDRPIGHVQFAPTAANTLMYSGDVSSRVWLVEFDGTNDRLLYRQKEGEFLLHEIWTEDGRGVYVVHWPFAVRRLAIDGSRDETVTSMNAWHIALRRDGRLIVCDTNHPDTGLHLIDTASGRTRLLCLSKSSNKGWQWRYTFPRGGAHIDTTIYRSAGTEETDYGPQHTHPHPTFNPAGDKVVFTSDRSGISQVYVVEDVPLTWEL